MVWRKRLFVCNQKKHGKCTETDLDIMLNCFLPPVYCCVRFVWLGVAIFSPLSSCYVALLVENMPWRGKTIRAFQTTICAKWIINILDSINNPWGGIMTPNYRRITETDKSVEIRPQSADENCMERTKRLPANLPSSAPTRRHVVLACRGISGRNAENHSHNATQFRFIAAISLALLSKLNAHGLSCAMQVEQTQSVLVRMSTVWATFNYFIMIFSAFEWRAVLLACTHITSIQW